MRAVVQRVIHSRVTVDDALIGELDNGLLVYLGVSHEDTDEDVRYLCNKIVNLRIFHDEKNKMNCSIKDFPEADFMVISQFTLFGDVRKGRRPSFSSAATGEKAEKYYNDFISCLKAHGFKPSTGKFRQNMKVSYTNDGPITILLDSKKHF